MKTIAKSFGIFNKLDMHMLHVTRSLIKNKNSILGEFGLTCSLFEILSAINDLGRNKKDIIQIDLSKKTSIDPMTTSTCLRALEKRGLISRSRGVQNARIILIEMTPEGREVYSNALLKINRANEFLYQDIDKKLLVDQLSELSLKLSRTNL
ncbi:MAG: MarR family transcriptional regulator [Bacteroidetes bacterium]|jgi:MarR family transcriptional regulator, organic hydroperoxide resistance regulator|nr:MarR family transcriptional regulator [Bacteroidota bacterium]